MRGTQRAKRKYFTQNRLSDLETFSLSVNTFYDLPSLIQHASGMLNDVDVVSMDIFDTLFIRRIYDPDLIKYPVCEFIVDKAKKLGIPASRRTVWRARWEIEREHRRRHGKTCPDHEARYPEYMQEALDRVFGDKLPYNFLENVTDYELQMENAVLVPRAALAEWIKQLHSQNKRILLVSDIYLPSTHLKRLVDDKELTPYIEAVISSADTFNAKASGAAFPLIEEKYKLDKTRWLHVGDNPISDGLRPDEFGIHSLVLHDAGERQRKGIARSIHLSSNKKTFWKGRNVQQLMLPLEAENIERHSLYIEGYNFFGVLLGYFIQSIVEHCRGQKIKRVYFCAREGWTFKKYWEAASPYFFPHDDAPQAHYLYVSRMALAPTACATEGLEPIDTTVAMLPASSRDFCDICRVFSLDIEPLRAALERAGLKDDDPIGQLTPGATPELRKRFAHLLDDQEFQNEVKRQSQPAQLALERYLESERFFDDDEVALVDIGWLGTIQHYLCKAISHRADKPKIHGFLFGATRVIPYAANTSNFEQNISGVLFDSRQMDLAQSQIRNAKDVFEEVFRAPHPSLTAYKLEGDGFELKFREKNDATAQAEQAQSDYYEPLRAGIFDAAPRYAAAVKTLLYNAGELKPWINFLLINKLAYPRVSEIEQIRHESHQDDFAGTHTVAKKFIKENRTLWSHSINALKFNPFLRTRYYLKDAFDLLRGKQ